MSVLRIENHAGLIVSTNFWHTEMARRGLVYLSTNAGAFRLLVPESVEHIVSDMASGKLAVVSRGPWPDQRLADALEVMLDDGTDSPFSFHLDPKSLDRMPANEDQGKEWLFTVWTRPRRVGSRPHKALERPAFYRRVESLPCLLPYTPPGGPT